jgi:hypothetical protein
MTAHDGFTWVTIEQHAPLLGCIYNNAHYIAQATVSRKLGLDGVAAVNAWFPDVQFDRYLRKDSQNSCQTPTNPGYPLGTKNTFPQLVTKC